MIDSTGHVVPAALLGRAREDDAYDQLGAAPLSDRLGLLLEDILAVNRRLVGAINALSEMAERRAGVSSVEIKSSARGQDVTVKVYEGSDVQPVGDAAIAEYARIVAQLNQRVIDALAETVGR